MVMRIRSRDVEFPEAVTETGRGYIDITPPYGNGPWLLANTYTKPYYGALPKQYEEWTGDYINPGPPYREGHKFQNLKYWSDAHVVKGSVDTINSMWRYTGGFLPLQSPLVHLDYSDLAAARAADWGEIASMGATGWNKFRPTKSGADMGIFLGEIREVPRMLKTTAKGFYNLWRSMGGSLTGFGPKAVANHWLNTQFGWFPFLADLRKFYRTSTNLEKRWKQLKRDNNQWVKRGGNIKVEEESTVVQDDATYGLTPTLYTVLYDPTTAPYGTTRIVRKNSQHVWFKARFRYYIPNLGKSPWNARAIAQLFGLMPSPGLIWNLLPWSWLVDWVSNTGDALEVLSSILNDRLCAKYAYVMGTTRQEVESTYTANVRGAPQTMTWHAGMECLRREEASPFGFGLEGVDFDPRQWSILSALGLTRLR